MFTMKVSKSDKYKVYTEPLVSIVVATYRRDSSLEKSLVSLITQLYKNIEIIVVDDNADIYWNRKVSGIVKNIKNQTLRKIIYIKNEGNRGSAEARNIGIKTATGEYITFLDDDDIYLPNKIERQLNHILENGSDFSITDLHLYDENDKLIEVRNRNYIKNLSSTDLLKYHLMYHLTGTDTMMFKREYLSNIGGFPPINVGDEFYLMQKAIEAGGKFCYLAMCDVKAYVHTRTEGLSSGESKIKGENMLYEYKKNFFSQLEKKEVKYIKMRHFAVLAYAQIRSRKYFGFIKNSTLSFISSPYQCILLFFYRKQK